jgi:hypothetical protein
VGEWRREGARGGKKVGIDGSQAALKNIFSITSVYKVYTRHCHIYVEEFTLLRSVTESWNFTERCLRLWSRLALEVERGT